MVCRSRREDDLLRRAGRDEAGRWYLGRGPGRGLWWCAEGACAEGLSVRHLARALRAPADEADLAAVRSLCGGQWNAVVKE